MLPDAQPSEEDQLYDADLEHDYDVSTDADSTKAKSLSHKVQPKDKSSRRYSLKKRKREKFVNKISQYAGLYSATTFIAMSLILIKLETSIGNKIASLSWT